MTSIQRQFDASSYASMARRRRAQDRDHNRRIRRITLIVAMPTVALIIEVAIRWLASAS